MPRSTGNKNTASKSIKNQNAVDKSTKNQNISNKNTKNQNIMNKNIKNQRMPKILFLFLFCISVSCMYTTGCASHLKINGFHLDKLGKKEQGQQVRYEICTGKNIPERLQKILEERKKKPGTFAYKNSRYTYLIVCYGEKPYSGYSVCVEECWKDNTQLYLKTQLIGPAAGEEVVETLTYPFLVVRCGRTELLCRIES